jgi:hypothetical protein
MKTAAPAKQPVRLFCRNEKNGRRSASRQKGTKVANLYPKK